MNNRPLITHAFLGIVMLFSMQLVAQNKNENFNRREVNIDRGENINISRETDSAGHILEKMIVVKDGDAYKISLKDGKITAMTLNDKEVPKSEFSRHEQMVAKIRAKVKNDERMSKIDREKLAEDIVSAERDIARAERDIADADMDRLEHLEIDEKQIEEGLRQAEDVLRLHEDKLNKLDKEVEEKLEEKLRGRDDETEIDAESLRRELDKAREEIEKARIHTDRQLRESRKSVQRSVRNRAEVDRRKHQAMASIRSAGFGDRFANDDVLNNVIEDLVKEKVVDARNDVRMLHLSDEFLIVNDKKQRKSLQKKLKSKYLREPGATINYTR